MLKLKKNTMLLSAAVLMMLPTYSFAADYKMIDSDNGVLISIKSIADANQNVKIEKQESTHPVSGKKFQNYAVYKDGEIIFDLYPKDRKKMTYEKSGNVTVVSQEPFVGKETDGDIYINLSLAKKIADIEIEDNNKLNDKTLYPFVNQDELDTIMKTGKGKRTGVEEVINTKALLDSLNSTLKSVNLKGKTEKEQLKILMDAVCKKASYDYDAYNRHKNNSLSPENEICYYADGIAIKNKAVCDGYAEYYMLLCNAVGLDVRMVDGTAMGDTARGGHGWNVFHSKDGTKYYIDVTFSDTGDRKKTYKYFYKTADQMKKGPGQHIVENEYGPN